MRKLLSKLNIGKAIVNSKAGDKIVTGLRDNYGFRIEKKKLALYLDAGIVIILGLALLFGKVDFEEFMRGVENLK